MTEQFDDVLARMSERDALSAEAERISQVGTWWYHPKADTLFWSDEVYRIFGVKRGKSAVSFEAFLESVHLDDRQAMLDANLRALSGEERLDLEHRVVKPDGEVRHVRERAEVVNRIEFSGPVLIGTVQDITEKKRSEQTISAQNRDIANLHADLIYATRQSTMSNLAATLVHEISQPIAAITNYSAALKSLSGDSKIQEGINAIEQSALRAGEIIKRLKNTTKRTRRNLEFFNLTIAVAEAIEMCVFLDRGDIRVETAYCLGLEVTADRVEIQQVLVNLIRNAFEAVKDANEKLVFIQTLDEGDAIKVLIGDTGCGIVSSVLQNLFEAGVSSKPEGMGLGLSISRTIIENHRGKIGAENIANGASFWFTLPKIHP